jgi:hypothetical protein
MTNAKDWDGDSGRMIPRNRWDTALLFCDILCRMTEDAWHEPFISPCNDGCIHFSWYTVQGKFSVEYCVDNKWYYCERRGNGVSITSSGTLLEAANKASEVLKRKDGQCKDI